MEEFINIDYMFNTYRNLKLLDSGELEITIGDYCVRLDRKENLVILKQNNVDLKIPNSFNNTKHINAMCFFKYVIDAVQDKVNNELEKELTKSTNRFSKRFDIPSLNLINEVYIIVTNEGMYYNE